MEAVELEQIGTSIRSAMGDTAGQFRQAAARSNEEIGKVVKDISRMFKAQREELNEIGNTLQESIHQSESESAKMDRLAGIFEESVQIQSDMLTELKKTSVGMKYLGDSIIRLNNDIMSNGPNGLLGSLTGLNTSVGKIGTSVAAALLGAGIGSAVSPMVAERAMGGGGGTDYKMSGGETASGQKVMSGLQQRGFTKEEAAAISGNIAAESSFKTDNTNSIGAFGLMQWLDSKTSNRKSQLFEFARSQGKSPADFDVQLDFIKKELKGGGYETEQFNKAVKEAGGDVSKLAYLFGKYVERPSDSELAQSARKRQGVATSLYSTAGGVTNTTQSETPIADAVGSATDAIKQKASDFMKSEGRGFTTPNADQPSQAEKVPSADAPRTEPIGGEHGHGPISGAKEHGEKMGASEAKKFLQSRQGGGGGFVGVNAEKLDPAFAEKMAEAIKKAEAATGTRAVITEGYRPPEVQAQYYANYVQRPISWEGKVYNPQKQGGIAAPPGRSKHQRGLAVDLSDNAARDWLVAHAGELGLGRVRGDAPHFQSSGGVSEEAAAQTPYQTAGQQVTTSGESIPSTPGSAVSTSQATPVAQEPAVSGPSMGGMNPMAMMGMMGGMMPGGMGGIVGMVAPMLMSALGSIQAPEAAAATLETAPSTNVPAEMIQALSKSADNTKMLTQAAINKQVQQESAQDPITEMLSSVFGQQQNTPEVQGAPTMAGSYDGYNGPSDIGWPDWARMLQHTEFGKSFANYKLMG